jgi:hypothetical protein
MGIERSRCACSARGSYGPACGSASSPWQRAWFRRTSDRRGSGCTTWSRKGPPGRRRKLPFPPENRTREGERRDRENHRHESLSFRGRKRLTVSAWRRLWPGNDGPWKAGPVPREGRGARQGPDRAGTVRGQSVSPAGEMAEAADEVSEIRPASEIRTPQVEGSPVGRCQGTWFHCTADHRVGT